MSRKKLQQRVKSVASSTKSSSTAHAFTGSFSQSRARFNLQDHLPANPEQTQDTGAERYSLNAPPTFDTEFDEWNTQVQPGGPGVVGSPLQDNNLNNVHVNEEDEDFEEFILGATHQKRVSIRIVVKRNLLTFPRDKTICSLPGYTNTPGSMARRY